MVKKILCLLLTVFAAAVLCLCTACGESKKSWEGEWTIDWDKTSINGVSFGELGEAFAPEEMEELNSMNYSLSVRGDGASITYESKSIEATDFEVTDKGFKMSNEEGISLEYQYSSENDTLSVVQEQSGVSVELVFSRK